MPCDSRLVGITLGPFEYEIDQFWTMAYAAGLGDSNPRYLDSLKSGHLIAHPVFPVCLALRSMGPMDQLMFDAGLTHEESIRRVHATQDMILHRPIRPPENIFVTTTLALMERRKPGTYLVTRYEIKDSAGAPLATLNWGRIFRNVEMNGPDRVAEIASAPKVHAHATENAVRATFPIAIADTAAIVYTACARPGNSVNFHTDTVEARRSGLPAPILMGVATLGMSVSKIVEFEADGDPARVSRVYGRFGAMVLMPSEITVRVLRRERSNAGDAISFETTTEDGGRAIRDGVVMLHL
jgi:acyl dehydratase